MSEAVVIVSYRALPGKTDVAKQAISALVATVLSKEAECGGITILQDSNDPVRFTLIERWPSQEIFLGRTCSGRISSHLSRKPVRSLLARQIFRFSMPQVLRNNSFMPNPLRGSASFGR